MKKIIVLDYFLLSAEGHEEQYDFAITREALKQGIEAEIWCPKRTVLDIHPFVKQCLDMPFWKKNDWKEKLVSVYTSICEIRRILKNPLFNETTMFIIPTIRVHLLFFFLLGTIGIKIKPKLIVVLRRGLKDHYALSGYVTAKLKEMVTLSLMQYLAKNKNMYFLADSELITAELKKYGFKTKTLPIPHLPPYQQGITVSNDLTIGYFGGARFDKGFDLLPELVRKTMEQHVSAHFILHTYAREGDKLSKIVMAKKELHELAIKYPNKIEIIDRYLSVEEYSGYMRQCSIVLVPYRKEFYGKGTSGILAEAIACGAWIIVPADTWMADQHRKYSKVKTFYTLQINDLNQAMDYCIKNNKNIDEQLIGEEINKWYAFHSPQNYLNILSSF